MPIIFQSLIHCHSKRQSKANVAKKSFQLRQKRKRPPIPEMVIDPWTDRGILDFHKRDRLLFAPTNQTLSRLISIKNEPKLFSKWQLATVRPNSHTLMNFSWPLVVVRPPCLLAMACQSARATQQDHEMVVNKDHRK